MKYYILQHTLTNEILGVFTNKELAEKWNETINYSILREGKLIEN